MIGGVLIVGGIWAGAIAAFVPAWAWLWRNERAENEAQRRRELIRTINQETRP